MRYLNKPITLSLLKDGHPFIFGGFESKGEIIVCFSMFDRIHTVDIDQGSFQISNYDMYIFNMFDMKTGKYIGKHALQSVIVEIKSEDSWVLAEFEDEAEEAKIRLAGG
jgi:hypothetical protein